MPKLRRLLDMKQLGFTMIELLVVIAVIGVLAVAVLSSINPIEQINKGRDTRTRSDAAQLINAVDRYFATREAYPWNTNNSAVSGGYSGVGTVGSQFTHLDSTGASWAWAHILTLSDEVKLGYYNRIVNDDALYVQKATGEGQTMYSCFRPRSNAFKQEALNNCLDQTTPTGIGVSLCPYTGGITDTNYICLP
jgi:prepilin-type N-terminal cleavage/methylation domain-containing protein